MGGCEVDFWGATLVYQGSPPISKAGIDSIPTLQICPIHFRN